MSANLEAPSSSMDALKWVIVIALLSGAVVGNYMFEDHSALLRAIGVVIAIAAGLGMASQTIKGRAFIAFAKEAKLEVRKVVWPTRQETVQTTLIVMIATVIVAGLLWGLDTILFKIVGFLTGLEI